MPGAPLLLTPGPTPIPPSVLKALALPVPHHRTKEFEEIFGEVRKGLRALFQTESDPLVLASTGTGAMEASIANLFSPGDSVVAINAGKFGERFVEISKAYGLGCAEILVERGKIPALDAVRAVLKQVRPKALLFQANETSTGARLPVQELAQLAREAGALSVVDGITACGVFDVPMDRWGIDVLMTASQKALMLPPGLSFLAFSERAWSLAASSTLPKYYFDLQEEKKMQAKNQTAWTPAISLIVGLRESLRLLLNEEGLKNAFTRQERLARATRSALVAMGLKLFAPDSPSPAITSVHSPDVKDAKRIPEILRDEWQIVITGGQDELAGKILRIAHMGYLYEKDLLKGITALEAVLKKLGHPPGAQSGVRAFEEEWGKNG